MDVMLAKKAPAPFDRPGWIFEFKYDGWRVIARRAPDGRSMLRSRQKVDLTARFPAITQALTSVRATSFALDGELCFVDANGVPDFEALQRVGRPSRFPVNAPELVYFVFDLLELNGADLRPKALLDRKARLKKLVAPAATRVRYVDHIDGEGKAAYAFALQHRFEGIVGKDGASPYVQERSDRWLKIKPAGLHDGWKRPLRHRKDPP